MSGCPKRAPVKPLPAGMTLEAARQHPRWAHALEPGGPCELGEGHEPADRHKCGALVWYDPARLTVGEAEWSGIADAIEAGSPHQLLDAAGGAVVVRAAGEADPEGWDDWFRALPADQGTA